MIQQTVSGQKVQAKIDKEAQIYASLLASEAWSLETARMQLRNGTLDLFQLAGLAKAIACFQ